MISEAFGAGVAEIVLEVTDDKRLPKGGAQGEAGSQRSREIAARQGAKARRQNEQPKRNSGHPSPGLVR